MKKDYTPGNGNAKKKAEDTRLIFSFPQRLMIILGSVTVSFGFCCFFFMVVDPKASILHLTPEQEKIVDLRILDNHVRISTQIKFSHIKECLREPRYYCYTTAGILTNIPNGAIFTFMTILISHFGFSVKYKLNYDKCISIKLTQMETV
jgi:hypothetical protein